MALLPAGPRRQQGARLGIRRQHRRLVVADLRFEQRRGFARVVDRLGFRQNGTIVHHAQGDGLALLGSLGKLLTQRRELARRSLALGHVDPRRRVRLCRLGQAGCNRLTGEHQLRFNDVGRGAIPADVGDPLRDLVEPFAQLVALLPRGRRHALVPSHSDHAQDDADPVARGHLHEPLGLLRREQRSEKHVRVGQVDRRPGLEQLDARAALVSRLAGVGIGDDGLDSALCDGCIH